MKKNIFILCICFISIFSFSEKPLKAELIRSTILHALKPDVPGNNPSDTLNNFKMAGDYIRYAKNKNIIDFQCSNAKVRLEICADDIFRIRMSPAVNFKPNEPWVVIRYEWPANSFTVKDKKDYISIETKRRQIKAFKSPFRFEFFDLNGTSVNKDWKGGSMGFRGEEIICKKELTQTDHFFGLGQRFEKSDLRGTKTTCLVTREYTPVPFYLGTDGYGIFFHNTFASSFELYEDDGESYEYEKDVFSITKFTCKETGNELLITKSAPVGKYAIPERDHIFCVHKNSEVKDVVQAGRTLPLLKSEKEFNLATEGWMQEAAWKKLLWI